MNNRIDLTWIGVTRSATMSPEAAEVRHRLVNAAKSSQWENALSIMRESKDLANCWRPDGQAWYTPLHHAAYNGAPVEVVQALIELGSWRTLRTAAGERAVDIARKRGHTHLVETLDPVYRRSLPLQELARIQTHFHEVIQNSRAGNLVKKHALRLPELEMLLEFDPCRFWCPIPEMYGGFAYSLQDDAEFTVLVSESWSRIVGGSGQRHIVSQYGHLLIAEGFV